MLHPMIGKVLQGRYQIVQILNTGVFGQTYIAEDAHQPGKPKCVVKHLKVANNEPNYLATIRQRFQNETETLQRLGYHHRIPHLIASFEQDEQFYLVQEYINGHSLTAELPISLRWGQLWSESDVVTLLQEVLEILEFVHSQDVIHCDIKPDNLIRRAFDAKLFLIDFGSVQPLTSFEANAELPIFRLPVTSLGYIPPEQFNRQPQPNSDIYALGMIAIQALTGRSPTELTADIETHEVIWQLPEVVLNDQLVAIINQMVRHDYKQRYQSATEVLKALQNLYVDVQHTVVSSTPDADAVKLTAINKNPGDNQALITDFLPVVQPQEKPSILVTGMKVGVALNSLVMGMGVYSLLTTSPAYSETDRLQQAKQEYQTGDLDKAISLANSIKNDSSVYPEAQAAIKEWRQDWQIAAQHFQAAEIAFNEQRWTDVQEQAAQIPNISYWKTKIDKLEQQAQANIEVQAKKLLQTAYEHAEAKDFSVALEYLQQIPKQSSVGGIVHQKLTEYTEKRGVRAVYLLQKAYEQAAAKNFSEAVNFLKQIPQDTPAYEVAQLKLTEYQQKGHLKDKIAAVPTEKPQSTTTKPVAAKTSQAFINSNTSIKLQNLQPGNSASEVNIK